MTKRKADKKEKPINQTAHQRAMQRPEVRETLKALRTSWSDLSQQQRGEKLNVLIGFGCSRRKIADGLGESESSIRRSIAKANPPEEGNDWATMMKGTIAEKSQKQRTKNASEDVRRIPSKIPAMKSAAAVIRETCPTQDHAHATIAKQTKKITSPLSTAIKEPRVVSGATSGPENQAGENTPRTNPVEAISNMERVRAKIQRLASIPDQIKRRPLFDARSLGRQGRPLPPEDRH